jgi:hypothetical protein
LGLSRTKVRGQFAKRDLRGHRFIDVSCAGHIVITVGYPSSKLLASVAPAQRRGLGGRAVLILTSSRHFALRGVRPGTRLATVAPRLHVGRPFAVGHNRWYLLADGSARGVAKVRHGIVEEVGIANRSLTNRRARARRFLGGFSTA